MQNIRTYMELNNPQLAQDMEVYDKLNDSVNNYLNVGAVYGYESQEAKAVLYRGMRNAFFLGQDFEAEIVRQSLGRR